VGQCEVGVVEIELKLMTRLAMSLEGDSSHESTFCLDLVTIIAIKLSPPLVDRRDIGPEMAAMIETQDVVGAISSHVGIRIANFVGIGCFSEVDPKFRMIIPES